MRKTALLFGVETTRPEKERVARTKKIEKEITKRNDMLYKLTIIWSNMTKCIEKVSAWNRSRIIQKI